MSGPSSCSLPSTVATLRAAGCVFAEEEARLLHSTAGTPSELTTMVDRRVTGLPLEYVIGFADFCGQRLTVEAGVFVPRRRTGFLVRRAAAVARPGAVVVDLCCGCGAVGAALTAALRRVELYAVDIDPVAVRCARRNLAAEARVFQGDLYAPLPTSLRGRVEVLTANTPHVPTGSIRLLPREARLHEPRTALDGGEDGLELSRRIGAEARRWLAPGGHVLLETGRDQAARVADVLSRAGLVASVSRSRKHDATVVVGCRGPGRAGRATGSWPG